MLEINKWFFVQLINFLLLIVLLNQILFKPLLRMFKERQDRMKNALDSAKTMGLEKDDLINKINARLLEVRHQARTIHEEYKTDGLNVQKGFVDTAGKEASEMTARALKELGAEVENSRKALKSEVNKFADEITRKLITV
ncbi:MAG: ATP synthase F0 subunit B [Nitrospirae bacterium]|nr:ATP synthase F0 subunit B [Nitrospirota bacterium]